MTSRFWARFAPYAPRVIALRGLAASLGVGRQRSPALAVASRRVDASLRPQARAGRPRLARLRRAL